MLKSYRCPNCGQMINMETLKCDYCGTQYEREGKDWFEPITVQACNAQVVPLTASVELHDYDIPRSPSQKEEFVKFSIDEIAHKLAGEIVPFTEIRTYKDLRRGTTIIAGRLKVIEPDLRINDWKIEL